MQEFVLRFFSLLLPCCLLLARYAMAQNDPGMSFEVSYHVLGPAADRTKDFTRYFVSRMDARPGFSVKVFSGKQGDAWDKPPAGVEPGSWISLVQVAFGDRDDWLALVFDGPSGAMAYAGRRPAQRRIIPDGMYIEQLPPGPDQVDRNSVIELAGDFFYEYPAWKKQGARPALHVELRRQKSDQGHEDGANLMKGGSEMDDSMSVPEFEGLRALALAAVCRAGWSPTTAQSDHSLELSVSRQVLRYTVQASFISPKGKQEITKDGLPHDELYESFVRLFADLIPTRSKGVDFASVDMWPVRPVWVENNLLAVEQGDSLMGFNMETGERKWALSSPIRQHYRFAACHQSNTTNRVFITAPRMAPVNIADGKRMGSIRGLDPVSYPWGFALSLSGTMVTASENLLAMYDKEDKLWEHSGPMEWAAGPCVNGERVFAGNLNGRVVALNAADGKLLWSAALNERLYGLMAVAEGVIALVSREGVMFALSETDGKTLWTLPLGDLAIDGPYCTPHGFFVASGNSRLWLINPVSGKVVATSEWSVPLLSAMPLVDKPGYVCSDAMGRVAFLNATDLAVVRQVELRAPLTLGLLPVGDMFFKWGARDEFAPRGPAVIVGDENGFLHLLAVEASD